jgi:hypothetical protein
MDEEAFTGRRSLRLEGFDSRSPGAYFVTICAYQRELIFEDAAVASVVRHAWHALPGHFAQVDSILSW